MTLVSRLGLHLVPQVGSPRQSGNFSKAGFRSVEPPDQPFLSLPEPGSQGKPGPRHRGRGSAVGIQGLRRTSGTGALAIWASRSVKV